jgi:hypothetical protein
MNTSFILRFQEDCRDSEIENAPSGTKTITKVRAESSDSEWDRSPFGEMRRNSIMAGTATRTFAGGEGSDNDKDYQAFRGCPANINPIAGTQTQTRVSAEAPDEDRGVNQFCSIPSCFSS